MADATKAQNPNMRKPLPDQSHLRNIFQYDQESGNLVWKKPNSPSVNTGDIAGAKIKTPGGMTYIQIRIGGKKFYAHRLIWAYVHAEIAKEIDHIDLDGTNNRLENLRVATKSQNCANRKNRKNLSGFRGVYKKGNRWSAQIRVSGILEHLGTFDLPEDAHVAYRNRAIEAFGEFAFAQ